MSVLLRLRGYVQHEARLPPGVTSDSEKSMRLWVAQRREHAYEALHLSTRFRTELPEGHCRVDVDLKVCPA